MPIKKIIHLKNDLTHIVTLFYSFCRVKYLYQDVVQTNNRQIIGVLTKYLNELIIDGFTEM